MAASGWYVGAVKAREAMSKVIPLLGPQADWKGIAIAHLDTGYTNHVVFNLGSSHPSLQTALGVNYMDAGATLPLDPLDYGGQLFTFPGHGTRTAGVLCGNLPGTYVGLAPTVPVIPYRITNSVVLNGRTIRNAAAAIMDAVDRNLADIVSMSLGVQSVFEFGNKTEMKALGRAVDHAYEQGTLVIGAGGQTRDAPELVGFNVYPGRYSRAIGVGGINDQFKICFDYEVGRDWIDVWAPADDILRPNAVPGTPDPFTQIADKADGTSYATVHVAAAAAMWLRVRGEELASGGYDGWRRVEAFRAMLRATKQTLKGNSVRDKAPPTGTGALDCLALLTAPLPALSSLKERTTKAEGEHN